MSLNRLTQDHVTSDALKRISSVTVEPESQSDEKMTQRPKRWNHYELNEKGTKTWITDYSKQHLVHKLEILFDLLMILNYNDNDLHLANKNWDWSRLHKWCKSASNPRRHNDRPALNIEDSKLGSSHGPDPDDVYSRKIRYKVLNEPKNDDNKLRLLNWCGFGDS